MDGTLSVPLRDRVKDLRDKAGLTQQQVAERAGLSISIVTKIEYGLTGDPRWSTMLALARGLGCSVADLVDPPSGKNEDP